MTLTPPVSQESIQRKQSDIKIIKRLFKKIFVGPFKQRIVYLMAVMASLSLTQLVNPFLVKMLLDEVITPALTTQELSGLYLWFPVMIVLILLSWGLKYYREYLREWLGASLQNRLRTDMFIKLQHVSLRYFVEKKTGNIMSLLTNDTRSLYFMMGNTIEYIISVGTIIGTIVAMLILSFELTLVSLVFIPVIFLTIKAVQSKMRKAQKQTKEKIADVTSKVQESVSGVRIVKAFAREKQDTKSFITSNLANLKSRLRVIWVFSQIGIVHGLLRLLFTLVILWIGVTQILAQNFTIGSLLAFQLLSINFINLLQYLASFSLFLQGDMASAERIFGFLDENIRIEKEDPQKTELTQVKGEIRYDNVTFKYQPHTPLIKNLNILIKPCETVALVGSSGAGKSTLINLLCRFYEPDEGTISIDGYDIKKVSLESLRSQIGVVPQDPFLFEGTVKENIRYGKSEASDEEIIASAKSVGAHEFITHLPEGYETLIHEGAHNLSGGQKQLICLARTIIKNPRILILDEATSNVDSRTEMTIQNNLENLLKKRTALIVAHRISAIKNVDKILVVDDGKIVETGNHDQLIEKKGLYSRLYKIQTEETG